MVGRLASCYPWSGTIVCFGTRVRIRTNDPGLPALLPALAPPLATQQAAGGRDVTLSVRMPGACVCGAIHEGGHLKRGRREVVRSRDPGFLRLRLQAELKFAVSECAPRSVFVHAGAVGWQGRGVVLPGASMAGKTSLVRALIAQGATYYSDEFAVLDAAGRLHPYPQPLAVRRPGSPVQVDHPAASLGAVTGTDPLPLGLVVFTEYEPAARWSPAPLSAGQAALALLEHAVAARRAPERVLRTLTRAVRGSGACRGARGDAEETARAILAMAAAEVVG